MDSLPDPVTMTDQALLHEWECVEECDYGAERTDALAAELEKRSLEF